VISGDRARLEKDGTLRLLGRGSLVVNAGGEKVALVELRDTAPVTAAALRAQCALELARFKAPEEFVFVEQVHRLGNGKADYRWAKSHALKQAEAEAPMST
jgi:fatty-acyl-CoA synthase